MENLEYQDVRNFNNKTMKNCNKCLKIKIYTEFFKDKYFKDGHSSICKLCKKKYSLKNKHKIKEWHKNNYIKHKNDIDKTNKKWAKQNRQKVNLCRKNWRAKNKDKVNKRKREQYNKWKKDPFYNLKIRLRNRLNAALKSKCWRKNTKFNIMIGCNKNTLLQHIESRFQSGMTWNNRNLWHLDHIIPVSSACNIKQLEKLFYYTNLQPLWAEDNIKKSDSCPQP